MIELALRLVASLAVVVGLLLVLARLGARRFAGGSDGLVHVVHRQPLSRTSSLAVVDVAGRILVLGTTEHQVSLLTELDASDLEDDDHLPEDASVPPPRTTREETATTTLGTLGGSVLSPATWQAARQALGVRPAGGSSSGRRRADKAGRAS